MELGWIDVAANERGIVIVTESSIKNIKQGLWLLAAASMIFSTACGGPDSGTRTGSGSTVNVPFVPEISVNEIMVGQIDHAAHSILELTMDSSQQMTIGAWQELEHYAIQLQSSTSAITMGGSGVNDAMWVAQSGWRNFARQLNGAAVQALEAARQQELPAMLNAGDKIRASCDGCHQQYKPEIPTEGFYRIH